MIYHVTISVDINTDDCFIGSPPYVDIQDVKNHITDVLTPVKNDLPFNLNISITNL